MYVWYRLRSMETEPRPRPRRLSQPERSAATRQALIDATIECLVELGYQNATTGEISERAGLSRGAHLHHFQTRATLFAATAAELAERGQRQFQQMIEGLPSGAGRRREALERCWAVFNGAEFLAVAELSAQARTDPGLAEAVRRAQLAFGRDTMPRLRQAFGVGAGHDDALSIVLATIRGLVLLRVLEPGDDPEARWKRARGRLLSLLEEGSAGATLTAA
jgi:AcrR family transcriptional regulator